MPFEPNSILPAAAELVLRHRKILVLAHLNPDGDAWGSMCAMARICLLLGREARLILPVDRADFLSWLTPPVPVCKTVADCAGWKPDLAVFLDCGHPNRTGSDGEALAEKESAPNRAPLDILNIDHHGDNPRFGTVNWVNPEAGATAELVGLLAEYLGFPLSGDLGEAVYLGLTADSGNFTYSSATPGLFAMAARIVRQGLKVEDFTAKSENNWSQGRMRLWGEILLNLRFFAQGKAVSALIGQNLLNKHTCTAGDLDNLVSFLLRLREVEVAALIREKAGDRCKISLRSKGGMQSVDVRAVAAALGGGGHTSAAGVDLGLGMEQAEKKLLEILIPALESLDEGGSSGV